MAPLPFGDKINIISMIGTWLGTLFTLIGLAAVITQLRSILKDFSNDRKELVKAAAGDWALILPTLGRLDNGIIEGKAPSLRKWIYHHYNKDKEIVVCPHENRNEKGSKSGQSNWTKLFSRLQILPEDILRPGYKSNPNEIEDFPDFMESADILVDGTKLSYGVPVVDFIVLLILAGHSPSKFDAAETVMSSGHLGQMYLATHSDPFSQVAQLDHGTWNTRNTVLGSRWEGRWADHMNVRRSIDVALGILRFELTGQASTLLFCTGEVDSESQQSGYHTAWPRPSPKQQLLVRRNLTALTGGSMVLDPLYDVRTHSFPKFSKFFMERTSWKELQFCLETPGQIDSIFEVAFGIKALKPWGMLAVIPKAISNAFCPHLLGVLAKSSRPPLSQIALIEQFRVLLKSRQILQGNIPHRTKALIASGIESLYHIRTRNFSGLSAHCSLYFDTMIYVFKNNNYSLEQVQIALAAHCGANYAIQLAISNCNTTSMSPELIRIKLQDWQIAFRAYLRECLNGSPIDDVEPWACEILATYLHAWLQESYDMDENFRDNFRRRVFMG